jgi:ABC-type polysaccharide/polyol phosphate export permease
MFKDILETLSKANQFLIFGFQDIKVRYRRSSLGVFWITINMAISITVLSFVFGVLFNTPIKDYIPYLGIGLILWGFVSTNINESCTLFISAKENILNLKMNYSFYILRALWRNIIILAHNILIIAIVFLVFQKQLSITSLYFIPGFILLVLNLTWMMFLIAIICTRYRDVSQIVLNIMQILFYLTPIIWFEEKFNNSFIYEVFSLNPFYHLLSIMRSPLLGQIPSSNNWIVSIVFLIIGSIITSLFFARFKHKIAYWL